MIVARVKQIKQETTTLMDLRDLEEIVINTMGEDTWNAIMYFTEEKIAELEEDISYTKAEERYADHTMYCLRSGISEEIEALEKLITKITEAKRLDRRAVLKELHGVIKRLEDNEGCL